MMDSFTTWYDGVRIGEGKAPLFHASEADVTGPNAVPTRLQDGPFGSDDTCQPQGFVHGGC